MTTSCWPRDTPPWLSRLTAPMFALAAAFLGCSEPGGGPSSSPEGGTADTAADVGSMGASADASDSPADAQEAENSPDASGGPEDGEPAGPIVVPDPALDNPSGSAVVDLGPVTFSPVGLTDTFEYLAPAEAISVTFVLVGAPGQYYTVHHLGHEDGTQLVPIGWYYSEDGGVCRNCLLRVGFEEQTTSAMMPNTPQLPYKPGLYKLAFFGIDGATGQPTTQPATLMAIVKKSSPPPGPGRLDLHLHFTGAGGLTAESAKESDSFRLAMKDLETRLMQADIALGKVTMDNISKALAIIETSSGPDNDLAKLFRVSAAIGGAGLHVFFVDELLSSGPFGQGGLVLGIAGGIPGPPLIPGTERSGIAVLANGWYLQQLGGIIGTTMAHETGHYLGLFHSTESNGSGDAINDTAPGDTQNLMHWSSTSVVATISPGQGLVIRHSPLIRMPTAQELATGPLYADP